MPNIPTYERHVLPQGGVNSRPASALDAGADLSGLARGIGQTADNLQTIEEDQARTWAATAVSQSELQLRKGLQAHVDSLDPSAPDYGQQIAKVTDYAQEQASNAQDDLLSQAPTPFARRMIANRMGAVSNSLTVAAMNTQAQLTASHAASVVQQGVAADTDLVMGSPDNDTFNRVVANVQDTVGGLAHVDPKAKQLMLDDSIHTYALAQGHTLASKHPLQFLKSVNADGGTTNADGALHSETVSAPTNFHADLVQPYTADHAQQVAAKVDAPSQYDPLFKAAAAKYGLDWRDLKMRSVVESNLNPSASSGQATGLMQLTPANAKALGVDPNDPAQSIAGAAQLLADAKAKGLDPDMAYYGGEDKAQWGPNTRQYAANLASVRSALQSQVTVARGSNGPGSEGSTLTPTQVYARNAPYVKPGVTSFYTQLNSDQEKKFDAWVAKNNIPFNPKKATPDYDMRGFWLALQKGDPAATTAIDKNDGKIHFPDKWKTPYDATFSAQSQYASSNAPDWKGGQLVAPDGRVLYDDKTHTWYSHGSQPPQVKPLDTQAVADAQPGMAGWKYLSLSEKLGLVRKAEGTLGKNLTGERAALARQVKDASAAYMNGQDYPAAHSPQFSQANFVRLFGTDQGVRLYNQVQNDQQVGGFISQVATMPVAQAGKMLQTLQPVAGPGFAEQEQAYQHAQKALALVDKQRRAAPVEFAIQHGIAGAQPLDVQNPQKLTAEIGHRVEVAHTMAQDYGTPVRIFTGQEVHNMAKELDGLSPDDRIGYLQSIAKGVSDPQAFSVAMHQLAPKNPNLAYAAQLAEKSGTVEVGDRQVNSVDVAKTIAAGDIILHGRSLAKQMGKDGQPVYPSNAKANPLNETQFQQAFQQSLKSGVFASPDAQMAASMRSDVYQAAEAYYADWAYSNGKDMSLPNPDDVANAVKAVAGEQVPVGNGAVFAPWGMDASTFRDEWTGRAQQALEAAGYDASTVADRMDKLTPITLGNGRYAFKNSLGQVLMDKSGARRVVVDFGNPLPPATLAERLKQTAPGYVPPATQTYDAMLTAGAR